MMVIDLGNAIATYTDSDGWEHKLVKFDDGKVWHEVEWSLDEEGTCGEVAEHYEDSDEALAAWDLQFGTTKYTLTAYYEAGRLNENTTH